MDLKNGAIDAVVIDEKPAQEFVKNNAKKLKLVVDSAGAEYYCIAITKGKHSIQRRDQQTDQSNQKRRNI